MLLYGRHRDVAERSPPRRLYMVATATCDDFAVTSSVRHRYLADTIERSPSRRRQMVAIVMSRKVTERSQPRRHFMVATATSLYGRHRVYHLNIYTVISSKLMDILKFYKKIEILQEYKTTSVYLQNVYGGFDFTRDWSCISLTAIFHGIFRNTVINVFAYILETNEDFNSKLNTKRHIWPPFIHRKQEPEGVDAQLEGCNRNLRPKVAVTNNNHLAPFFLGFGVKCVF